MFYMNNTDIAAAIIDKTGKIYRATLHGNGGNAAIGYGDTPDAARAHLAEVVAFNIANNGRAIA